MCIFINIALGINIISQCATERPRRKLTAYGRHSTKLRFVRPPLHHPLHHQHSPPLATHHIAATCVCAQYSYITRISAMQQTSFQTCRSLLLLLLLFVCGALSFSRANCFGFSSSNTPFPAPPGVCVVTFNYLRMLAPDGEMRCDAILSRTVARAMLSPFLH